MNFLSLMRKKERVDIRPPSTPLAIIKNSLTQFDGERALIVYTDAQAELYNLKQIERLLKKRRHKFDVKWCGIN